MTTLDEPVDVEELIYRPGAYIVTITPEVAARLLERNTRNRNRKERAINDYARQMTAGSFLLTNQGIGVDRNGELTDGQNRLASCEVSGVPFTTVFVTGLDPRVRDIVDTGVKRSFGDVLRMNGHNNVSNLAGAVSLRARYENAVERDFTWVRARSHGQRHNHEELLAFLDKHPALAERTHPAWLVRTALGKIGLSVIVAFDSMAVETDADAATAFREALISGALLTPGDPRLLLRNLMLRQERSPDTMWALGVWVKAWNLWRAGERRDVLALRETERLMRMDARLPAG